MSFQWSEASIITTDGKRRDLVAAVGSQKSAAGVVRTQGTVVDEAPDTGDYQAFLRVMTNTLRDRGRPREAEERT